jgi:hypothetical protein
VLGLDHLALVTHAALALLELDLELGELRLALVERRGAVGQRLLGADVRVIGLRPLLQLLAQRRLAGVRRLQLLAQLLDIRADDGLDGLARRGPRGQLEAQLDIGGRLRISLWVLTVPPALQLGAQAGAEPLLGLGPLVLGCVGHRCLRSRRSWRD